MPIPQPLSSGFAKLRAIVDSNLAQPKTELDDAEGREGIPVSQWRALPDLPERP